MGHISLTHTSGQPPTLFHSTLLSIHQSALKITTFWQTRAFLLQEESLALEKWVPNWSSMILMLKAQRYRFISTLLFSLMRKLLKLLFSLSREEISLVSRVNQEEQKLESCQLLLWKWDFFLLASTCFQLKDRALKILRSVTDSVILISFATNPQETSLLFVTRLSSMWDLS